MEAEGSTQIGPTDRDETVTSRKSPPALVAYEPLGLTSSNDSQEILDNSRLPPQELCHSASLPNIIRPQTPLRTTQGRLSARRTATLPILSNHNSNNNDEDSGGSLRLRSHGGPQKGRIEPEIPKPITAVAGESSSMGAQSEGLYRVPVDERYSDFEKKILTTVVDFFEGERCPSVDKRKSVPSVLEEPLKDLHVDQTAFRWIHLPANNMAWVEILIRNLYAGKRLNRTNTGELNEEEMSKASQNSRAEYILAPQRWARRQYENPERSPGARFMKPLFAKIARVNEPASDTVVFMPYLHWEHYSEYRRRIQSVETAWDNIDLSRRAPPAEKDSSPYTEAKWQREKAFYQFKKFKACKESGKKKQSIDPEPENLEPGILESKLIEKYLDTRGEGLRVYGGGIKYDDPLILQSLHLRRTLDRSYYYTLGETEIQKRDVDQVLYRHTYGELELYDPILIMVDQLWLWIIDECTVITAFPRRCRIRSERRKREDNNATGQHTMNNNDERNDEVNGKDKSKVKKDDESEGNEPENVKGKGKDTKDPKVTGKHTKDSKREDEYREDDTDVQMRIINAIESDYKYIKKPEQLAGLIIDKCSGVFFPEGREENDLLDFLDVFAVSIARLSFSQAQAFNDFCNDSRRPSKHNKTYQLPTTPSDKELRQRQNHYETCGECKTNLEHVEKFWPHSEDHRHPTALARPDEDKVRESNSGTSADNEDEPRSRKQKSLVDISLETEYVKEIKDIMDELNSMARVFEQQIEVLKSRGFTGNSNGPNPVDLLDPRGDQTEYFRFVRFNIEERLDKIHQLQKDAERVYDALRDLLDLKQKQASVKQSDDTAQQNTTVLVFTIVTIFFSPLSFVAGIFSMNAKEINGTTERPLSHIWRIMYPATLGVLIFSVILAFAINPVMKWGSKVLDHIWQVYTRDKKKAKDAASSISELKRRASSRTGTASGEDMLMSGGRSPDDKTRRRLRFGWSARPEGRDEEHELQSIPAER